MPASHHRTWSAIKTLFITGPPTHSVGGQTSNCRWRLLSFVGVCNTRICNSPGGSTRRSSSVTGQYLVFMLAASSGKRNV